ncbi:hypothetical protein C8J57DRAFT_1065839 [Mycena rebaudengoi]|nr:hypothetical protein C8J57DRAFT_1065839 [Mycena rebaudengoi]
MQQRVENRHDVYVKEVLRLEGRGGYRLQESCAECAVAGVTGVHRCNECFTDALFCSMCMVRLHADNPFHTIESWTGTEFTCTSLHSLGLRIQLGHGRNGKCPGILARSAKEKEKADKTNFCIVDSNGVHEVGVDFCICALAQDADVQLLCAHLYPSTSTQLSSTTSVRLLRKFHISSFESKCSAYEFYNGLARETDNTGIFQPRVSAGMS